MTYQYYRDPPCVDIWAFPVYFSCPRRVALGTGYAVFTFRRMLASCESCFWILARVLRPPLTSAKNTCCYCVVSWEHVVCTSPNFFPACLPDLNILTCQPLLLLKYIEALASICFLKYTELLASICSLKTHWSASLYLLTETHTGKRGLTPWLKP